MPGGQGGGNSINVLVFHMQGLSEMMFYKTDHENNLSKYCVKLGSWLKVMVREVWTRREFRFEHNYLIEKKIGKRSRALLWLFVTITIMSLFFSLAVLILVHL